jgi:hypothetical protein
LLFFPVKKFFLLKNLNSWLDFLTWEKVFLWQQGALGPVSGWRAGDDLMNQFRPKNFRTKLNQGNLHVHK